MKTETSNTMEDVTCFGCDCLCDDIAITVRDARIERAERACELGEKWFFQPRRNNYPDCLIEGRPASVEDAINRAADILRSARYPLIHGLRNTMTEAQAAAISIADWIGACVDSTSSLGPIGLSVPGTAEITATLGEIRNRSDVVIFWGTDPVVSHPRHLARYSIDPRGTFIPNGRTDRTCVVVDVKKTQTANLADVFLKIKRNADFEAIWTLRALEKRIDVDAKRVKRDTGIDLPQWRDLLHRMKSARYGAVFFGRGLTEHGTQHASCDALFALLRDLNQFTRFVGIGMDSPGNQRGAYHAMSWRTGYPLAVNLARGYPRYGPGEYTGEKILGRGEADAALIVAADPIAQLEPVASKNLRSIPYVAIDSQDSRTIRHATVAFHVAVCGIDAPGTVYRMDHVPMTLRPPLASSRPTDLAILQQIESALRRV